MIFAVTIATVYIYIYISTILNKLFQNNLININTM